VKARLALLLAAGAVWLFAQGVASRGVKPAARGKASGKPFAAKFTDVARAAGLTKPVIYGGADRTQYLVETSSGGVALFDYDNDGLLDIFLAGGTRFGDPAPPGAGNFLYRNRGDGTFEDVTERVGVRRPGWASGAAIGDYDNDGYTDLFVTYWGQNILFRNRGDGTFEEATERAGLLQRRPAGHPYWGAGATFLDFDGNGHLDLFVANYVDFNLAAVPRPGENIYCNWKGVPVACGPRGLPTARHFLFRNDGKGRFVDVSAKSGIAAHRDCYGMTAISFDADDDGRADIYVACDSTPSLLLLNNADGTFREEGIESGLALSDDGREQAGMGLGVGDFNLDGRIDLFKTHFADDTHGLYFNEGAGQFREVTLGAGLAVETRYVGWGAGIHDLDNDGHPDIFIVTGNVYPETEAKLPAYPYKTSPLLFRNLGGGKFEQLVEEAGPALSSRHSSRGCAFGDLDNDGDLDIVVWNRNEPPSLLRNDLQPGANWTRIRLEGTASNRSAIGAKVTVRYGGRVQTQQVLSQASFYSANDLRLHFGLGAAAAFDAEIRWPNGRLERRAGLKPNREYHWVESRK
jgi:enediyne biosynthesis protein E4